MSTAEGEGELMTSKMEDGNKRQQMATVSELPQRMALEMLLQGFSDSEIARELGIRRETIWKWKNRDLAFQAALEEGREALAEAATERLRGMLDQAATVVQKGLLSSRADPKLAMSLMKEMGVFERGLRVGRLDRQEAAEGHVTVRTDEEEAELEQVTRAIEEKIKTAKAITAGKRAG